MNETLFSLYAALPSTWRVKDESDAKRYFQLFMKMLEADVRAHRSRSAAFLCYNIGMTSCAWLWLYFGAFLMLMELLAPGFVVFFFGLSAATVGLCRFAMGESFTLTWQLAAFSAFSILYLVVLRRWLKRLFTGGRVETKTDFDNEYVGRVGRVTEEIKPPLSGRVMIGDAEWTASADVPLAVGTTIEVISQNNLTMKVKEVK